MRALGLTVMAVAAAACQAPAGPEAKVWTPREFFERRAVTAPVFGGWAPSALLVEPGQRIPYSTRTQAMGEGLPVQPGVSAGRAVGFVITDVWQDHPDPWVQPVWMPATQGTPRVRRTDVNTVFPVLAPPVDPALDVHTAYALRVARNVACFEAGFPASCDWLDSPAKLRALSSVDGQVRRSVVVTAPTLLELAP